VNAVSCTTERGSRDDLDRAQEAFAAGSPVLVGDAGDPVVFIAADARTIGADGLERIHALSGGMTALGITDARAEQLALTPLTRPGGPVAGVRAGLALTAPVDAAHGIRGGWSLRDRAHTMRIAADPQSGHEHLSVPGHVHAAPIGARANAAAEASLELARAIHAEPAVALGPLTATDGGAVSLERALSVAALAQLPRASSAEVRALALLRRTGGRVVECALPTRDGAFRAVALDAPGRASGGAGAPGQLGGEDLGEAGTVMALIHGDPATAARPLVHVHAACLLGDAFGSLACDCAAELAAATDDILAAGAGVIVYVKPGTADPQRRYHCGSEAPVDLAPVLAVLSACGVDASRSELTPATRWVSAAAFRHRS
jgi:3,4-dihydroxy 2-butanone 4-phosphate synthase/GTP cyclohydrolase II